MIGRRDFLRASGVLGAATVGGTAAACAPTATNPPGVFSLGVTAGLHSPTEVVLWTRVDLVNAPAITSVDWQVATSPAFSAIVASGSAPVSPLADGCVKVLVGSLDPDTSYWYRFIGGSTNSPVGRARTIPAPDATPTSLNLAFCSCQSYANGYYGAWRDIAAQDLDFVLFLGDYIYESPLIQILRPIRTESLDTIDTLAEYRSKYRLYRSDPDIQAAHSAHPMLPLWDDHEVFNDYDKTVFTIEPARAAAAYQAWFEYMPVWPVDGTRIYRNLRWGNLGEVFGIDSRQYRDVPLGESLLGILGLQVMTGDLQASGRSMLGTAQREWLLDGLDQAQADGVRWKLIGNPVMIAPIRIVDLDTPEAHVLDPNLPKHAGLYLGTDSWDGFGWERDLVLSHLDTAGVEDVAFLTGDQHSFFAAALTPDFDDPAAPKVAYEYTGGSISSPSGITENALAGGLSAFPTSPAFDYGEIRKNGYALVNCTTSEMKVTYMQLIPTSASSTAAPAVQFVATPGTVEPTITVL